MSVAHQLAYLTTRGYFMIESFLFQILQIMLFAIDVEGSEVILLFFRDFFFFDQTSDRACRIVFFQVIEVRIELRDTRARSGEGGRIRLAGFGTQVHRFLDHSLF